MKKLLYISLAAIILMACKPTDYKISGEVANINLNGQTITVSEKINREYVTLGRAVVEDAKFALTGKCDSAKIVFLHGKYPSGTPFEQAFILENGKISIIIDSAAIIFGGTEENKALQLYYNEKNNFYTEAWQFINSQSGDDGSVKNQELLNRKIMEFEEKEMEIDLNFIKNNANRLAGVYALAMSYRTMSIEEKENIFALMTDKTKNNFFVKQIIESTEADKKTAKGAPYVDISLPAPNDTLFSLSALVGKTDWVLVDFWASWCGPCIRSFPELKEFYARYGGTKLEILGVSLDSQKDAWLNAIATHQLGWKHISDLKGWESMGAALYNVKAIPATVLIDRNGIIAGKNLNIKQIEEIIQQN